MKKITIILLLVLLTGCVEKLELGAEKTKFQLEFEKQITKPEFKKEIDEGVEREYHHYLTPKGELGYVVIEKKEENNIIYQRAFDPTNKEVEKYRYYDWKIIQNNNNTASSSLPNISK